ncbi:MAG: hydantoinase B/oxoprolinase family protein [Burkholderiaceae bacterium]
MTPKAETASDTCDPVRLEIIVGAMRAMLDEMGALIERTAMSAMIREKKDYFVAIFDPQARMVAGTVLPLFGQIVRPLLDQYPLQAMRPGDIYLFNDCYGTGGAVSHSPDLVFIAPVFQDGAVCGFVQSWGHFGDIGGTQPGSISPTATSIFHEGILIPPVRLYREGVLNDELVRLIERNCRFPDTTRGDMRSLIAAVRLGERRLQELLERFGQSVVLGGFRQIQDRTERRARHLFGEVFKAGRYHGHDSVDTDGHGNGPFTIRMRMEVDEGSVSIDATGSDDQAVGPINFIMQPVVPSLFFGIYLSAQDPPEMLNDGMTRLIDEVKLRPGSLIQPRFPAPLGQRSLTWLRSQTALLALLNKAAPAKGMASFPAYTFYFLRGVDPTSHDEFLLTDGVAVGYGGRAFADGHDAVYFIAQENYPAEFLNANYPVRLLRYEVRCDSGGPGRYRGGCGVIREIEMLGDDFLVSTRIDATLNTPWGVHGGQSGRPGRAVLNPGRADERALPALSDGTRLRRGDVLRIETGGGGGFGHPFDRPADAVRRDVLKGFVSLASAQDDYGVVLGDENRNLEIDLAGTERRRAHRPATKLFHRNAYLDEL